MTVIHLTVDEARRILADQDSNTDPALALQAVAVWLRFEAIANPRLLRIVEDVESVALSLRNSPKPPP
jgi:hypothetical protein